MPRQIVILMTDTQRHDMLGCAGAPGIHTPALDGLAAESVRFSRAYTCQPVCQPARSALFTGTWPHQNGGWTNSAQIGDHIRTLGQRFSDQGFACGYIGKWHLDGHDYFGRGLCPPGWDDRYWFDMRRYLDELPMADRPASRRRASIRERPVSREFTFAHRVSNRALDFLRDHADRDFALVVSYDEPHGPFLCPPEYLDRYARFAWPPQANDRDDLSGKPDYQKTWAEDRFDSDPADPDAWLSRPRGLPEYFAANEFVDSEIGRVLGAVRRLAPGALIAYTSDHGDALGAHRLFSKGPCVYDEVARIPFMIRWPGVSPKGAVSPHPVSHIDLLPTLLDFAGLPQPTVLPGRSLRPACVDPAARVNPEIFIEFGRYELDHDGFGGFQPLRAIFDGQWKLSINLLSGDELYDLEADPGEMANRIHDPAARPQRDRLHDRLLAWMDETLDPFRGACWRCRPWRLDAAPATWWSNGFARPHPMEPGEPSYLDYDTGLPMEGPIRRR